MANFKKLSAFAPILSATLVVSCIGVSLSSYTAPVYAVEIPDITKENTDNAKEKSDQSKKEEENKKNSEEQIFDLEDGVYEGTGMGYAGKITVSVEIKDKKIVAIEILSVEGDDEAFFKRAKGVIDRIIEAQSLDVDVVSGATYSSRGIISAVKNALTGEVDDQQFTMLNSNLKTVSKVQDADSYKDGTYYGTANGFAGPLTVKVEISGGKITSITITETSDGSSYVQKASALISNIIATQSTNVDTVSGATFSSVGIIEAVRNALSKAGGSLEALSDLTSLTAGKGGSASGSGSTTIGQVQDADSYKDGTYYGTANGFAGPLTVKVEVSGGKITSIVITSTNDGSSFIQNASALIPRIISSQSTNVDTVSGATYSSVGIIQAVRNALSQAGGSSEPAVTLPSNNNANSGGSHSGGSTTIGPVQDASAYKDGTYYGTGTGFGGALTVKVQISGGKIASIAITNTSDGSSFIQNASALIPKIISSQSTNVDTVSGATYSSVGIIQAVRAALSQAAVSGSQDQNDHNKPETPTTPSEDNKPGVSGTIPYKDGVYSGVAEGYWGDVKVSVKIQDKTIKEIKILESEDDEAFFNRAMAVIDQVIKKQSVAVDTVSGATYSSKGILGAIEEALKEAERITNGSNIPESSTENTSNNTENSTEPSSSTESSSAENTSSSPENSTENTSDSTESSSSEDTSSTTEEETDKNTVYIDGDYIASVLCVPDEDEDFDPYHLSLKVIIQDDKIVSITDVAGDGDDSNKSYIKRAADGTSKIPGVVTQILEKGKLEGVDTVSRATCSSKAILDAVNQALENARRM